MDKRQTLKARKVSHAPLPHLWLISDARNDALLGSALRRLPRGSGLVFRHYHLPPDERARRWYALARIGRRYGHRMIWAGDPATARAMRADGSYGAPGKAIPTRNRLRIATAHSLAELAAARRSGADAVMLSPAFPTRSHPGARASGPLRFRLMAARADIPVIALGGMNRITAKRLAWPRWAAIDGLS